MREKKIRIDLDGCLQRHPGLIVLAGVEIKFPEIVVYDRAITGQAPERVSLQASLRQIDRPP